MDAGIGVRYPGPQSQDHHGVYPRGVMILQRNPGPLGPGPCHPPQLLNNSAIQSQARPRQVWLTNSSPPFPLDSQFHLPYTPSQVTVQGLAQK